MLNQPTIEKLQAMKLYGMTEEFRIQFEDPTVAVRAKYAQPASLGGV